MSAAGARTALSPHELPVPELPLTRSELSCGATLLVSPRADAPVVAAEVHLRGGHSLDPEGLGGVAYLTGALLDQGTRQRDEEEIAELLELAGGSVRGGATGLSGNIAAPGWRRLLDLMAEMMVAPRFPKRKVERQRGRLLDRLLVEEKDPRTQGARLFRRLVYGDHWLGRSDCGTSASVAQIERRHLAAFHRKHWCGARAVIAVCGAVSPADVKRHLERRLAQWPRGRDLGPRARDFPPLAPRAGAFESDRQQVHVFLGHLGIERNDPDFAPLVVMDHILGTGPGFTNRIPGKLRDELGLAYSVSANVSGSAGVLPGTFTAYIGTSPEHVDTAVSVFFDEIRRIQRRRVAPEELELAVRYLTGSMALGFERASDRAKYLVFAERCHLGRGHLERLLEEYAHTTAADVRRVAVRHLHPQAACLAAAGPLRTRDVRRLLRSADGRG